MVKYWIEDKARMAIFTTFAEIQYWEFSWVQQPTKENNGPQTGCEEIKLPLVAAVMTEQKMQKSVVFPQTTNEHMDTEIKNIIMVRITQNTEILGYKSKKTSMT